MIHGIHRQTSHEPWRDMRGIHPVAVRLPNHADICYAVSVNQFVPLN